MKYKKLTRKNFCKVLNAIKNLFKKQDDQGQEILVEDLESMLDDLLLGGFFGTEGQLDPRGDHRLIMTQDEEDAFENLKTAIEDWAWEYHKLVRYPTAFAEHMVEFAVEDLMMLE